MNKLEVIQNNWDRIKEYMKDEFEMMETSYKTWIVPLVIAGMKDDVLTLLFPEDEADTMISFIRKYQSKIRISIEAITGIVLDKDQINIISSAAAKEDTHDNDIITKSFPNIVAPIEANLNSKYTFDTFVVGNNNKLAHAASLAVAECPGEKYNPLFLYGGAGLGKTHLMHSIAHFIIKNDPNKNLLYISAENFMNEFIDSLKNNTNSAFRAKFRNLDVLLVDDIQFLEKRQGTQEEFFHTYEALRGARKQIVISSDKPPKELTTLEDRLRSRFEWGLAADISSPDFETRMAILRRKEEIEGYNIDNEVLNYIATNIHTNIRELEGALSKVNLYSILYKTKIDIKTAEEALRDFISPTAKRDITPELIISVVADHYGITVDKLCSEKRTKDLAYPRQVAMYLCKEMTGCTWNVIGDAMGGRDRTTIMHGHEKISQDIISDEILKETIDIIMKKVNPS